MSKQDLFIGRTDELNQIKNWISDWNVPQIVWINGDGGIGKTRLLKEIYYRFATTDRDRRLLILPIFDFDDRTLQIPENLEFEIARHLGEDAAKSYLRLLSDLRKMEAGDVSWGTIENQKRNLRSELLDSMNLIAKERRIVLLFDTTDAFDDSQKWGQVIGLLEDILSNLTNIFVAVAGRESREHQRTVGLDSVLYGHLINLAPFDFGERYQYVQQKQRELHIKLEPKMEDRVLALSQGKPILIDLATHWLAREYPVEWLKESELDQKEFEKKLVLQIAQIRSQMDRLILLLSRVYPLDVEAISELLKLPTDKSTTLFKEASSYVFIKMLPQEQIALHDEMRRMVLEFVWDELDPNKERRKRDSRLFVSYLNKKIAETTDRIQQLKSKSPLNDASAEFKILVERESLEHILWDLKEQRFYHLMYLASFVAGIENFIDLFDLATATYRFQLRDDLLKIANEYKDRLSDELRYEVENRNVRHLLDTRKYSQAYNLAEAILNQDHLEIEKRIDMLILSGNAAMRLGKLNKSIDAFNEAVNLSQKYKLEQWLARAKNALGWAYRNQGDYETALSQYLDAYLISYDLGDDQRTAWLLNNMGYINAYRGERQKALDNCWSALEIWEQLGWGRGVGAAHSTLGEVYRRFDQLSDALFHYNKALDIFSNANDIEWMSIVRCERGIAFLAMGDLNKALEDLNWSLSYSSEHLKPRVLHYQARYYMVQKNWDKAQKYLEESKQVSAATGNWQYLLKSFADLIDISWERGDFLQWEKFKGDLQQLCRQMTGEEVLRLKGSSLRKIGDLAICNGDYANGLAAYQEGLPLIAKYEVHSPYVLREQLKISDRRLRTRCSLDVLGRLGKDMEIFWRNDEKLLRQYPEALLTFNQWKRTSGDMV